MRGDGQNQLTISAPHPIIETYRLIPLLASLISLDSPFNGPLSLSSLAGLDLHIKIPLASAEREYARPAVILDGGGVSCSKILGMRERERMTCKLFYFIFITSRLVCNLRYYYGSQHAAFPKKKPPRPPTK
jgi:hypothetical protein